MLPSALRRRKGSLHIETVILIVLFVAIVAILIIIVDNIVSEGSDSMLDNVQASGEGAECEIQCMRCCNDQNIKDCSTQSNYDGIDLTQCCQDKKPEESGC